MQSSHSVTAKYAEGGAGSFILTITEKSSILAFSVFILWFFGIINIVITYETHCDVRYWNIDTRVGQHFVFEISLSSTLIYGCCSCCMYLPIGIYLYVVLRFVHFKFQRCIFI